MKFKVGNYVYVKWENRYGFIVGKRRTAIDKEKKKFVTYFHVPNPCDPGREIEEWYLKTSLEPVYGKR